MARFSNMTEATSGTFTFLLSDIEGSTVLARRLGDRWVEVLADHHRLLRTAFEQAGGQGIGTQGDAFFVAFRRPKDAIYAALAGQRSLAEHPWHEGVDLRVRMGIHTGEASISRRRVPRSGHPQGVTDLCGRRRWRHPDVAGDVRVARRRGARRFDVHVAGSGRADPQGLRAPGAPVPARRLGSGVFGRAHDATAASSASSSSTTRRSSGPAFA